MPPSRRRAIRVLAATGLASVAGCASVIDQTSNSAGDGGDSGQRTQVADDDPATPDADDSSDSADAEETQTTEQWSIEDVTIEAPAESFSSVPTPTEETTYATMGSDDVATATLFGNWKCPYTRDFVLEQLPEIVDEYVRPGDLRIKFRSLAYLGNEPFLGPDAPRAARAGLAIWESDPDAFWRYFMYVFENQPHERHAWAQPELLVRFAEAADVADPGGIRRAITGGEFSDPVEQTVEAAVEAGIGTVPRIEVDGEVTAPTVNPERTRAQLDEARDQ